MLLLLLLQLIFLQAVRPYKILGVFPHFGKSHFDIFEPVMQELALRGHEVTVVGYFPQRPQRENYNDVVMEIKAPHFATTHMLPFEFLKADSKLGLYLAPWLIHVMALQECGEDMLTASVLKFLETKQEFDAIIIEAFNTDCALGFVHKFPAPLIMMSSCGIEPWYYERFGIPYNPAYVPNVLMDFSDNMSFFERVENAVSVLGHQLFFDYYSTRKHNVIAKKVFGDDTPELSTIARNASLFLVNTHFTLNRPRALPPAVIEINGLHIRNIKNLPKNIEKWINESDAGVIYFSMGSMIKGHTFPEDKRQAFLRAFGRLRQRVLWKWENDTMPGKPDNVMIQKWMPQFDILCHPNVKAFISHGGLLGTTEAVHCGVPVVVMPQFGDQHTNAKALEAGGGGVVLNFADVDEDTVFNALQTVLDPGFNKKAKDLSERFKDRPMPPMETAIYWIEYVARHKGAHHLRTAAVGMPLYQYLLLDVIAFLILVITIATYVMWKLTKAMFRFLFRRQKSDKVKRS